MPTDESVNYSALAGFLSSVPEEFGIRRFRELHVQNLLFYQVELVQLERELRNLQQTDAKLHRDLHQRVNYRWQVPPATEHADGNWRSSSSSKELSEQSPQSIFGDYQTKVVHIRETLRKYDEAVRDFAFMQGMSSPSMSNIRHIKGWLERPELSNLFLFGEQNVWDEATTAADFLAFSSDARLSRTLGRVLVTARQIVSAYFTKRNDQVEVEVVDTTAASALSQSVSVILASVLPVLPIVILFFVPSLLIRIGLVFVFTASFAAALVFGLNLPPDTVLIITTAIATIQVVYVGSTGAQST